MKKTLLLALTCLVLTAGLAFAQGQNFGGQAYLSWSRDATVRDIPQACNVQNLYLKLANIHEVKGCEFELHWNPDEATSGMLYQMTQWPTRTSGDCTYLLRGTVVPITAVPDDGSSVDEAAAGSGIETLCTFGNVAVIQLDYSGIPGGCSTQQQAFNLGYVKVTDHLGVINNMTLVGAATIGGATAVPATTWGSIKSLYRN